MISERMEQRLMSDPKLYAIDIETVPDDNLEKYFDSATYSAPSNWKDPEKIKAYVEEAKAKDIEKAALNWWTGKIVCICMMDVELGETFTFIGPDEKQLLTEFLETIYRLHSKNRIKLIGKNGVDFDLPFITGRVLKHDLGIPFFLRPYHPIDDVDHIFSRSAHCGQRGSLSDYAYGLGLGEKKGHGSDVKTWYNAAILGDQSGWEKIKGYCLQDTAIVAGMVKRYAKDFVPAKTEVTENMNKMF